ncbi:CDP-alcohol phosphatidyltransferase [Gammaproteobacteria bacterium]
MLESDCVFWFLIVSLIFTSDLILSLGTVTHRDIPNLITLLRILLVPPFLFVLLERHYSAALILFFIAGVSDGLDGFLAKHYGWTSRLGSILDPLADKLLLVASFISLTQLGLIPFWLTVVVLGRDILIVVGAITYHFLIGYYHLVPAVPSKINTLVQIMLVLVVIISAAIGQPYLEERVIQGLVYLTLVTTIFSGTHYVVLWGRRAILARRAASTLSQ